ncbi:MAG: Peptidase sortase-like protein [Rhizorhabdus sp.]|nr:Peptidase sortase-like protein [Rhizorhabdus sp.]
MKKAGGGVLTMQLFWCNYIQDDMSLTASHTAKKKTFAQGVAHVIRRKWTFLAVFAVAFLVTAGMLAHLDLLPDTKATVADATPNVNLAASPVAAVPAAPELPTKIEIPAIGLSQTIQNPTSTNIEKLDQALLSGLVRYPTSAKLGEQGNIIVFGHSSYLPVVNNPAYKAMDGIQKLKKGDTITVYGNGRAYVYAVESVSKEDANSAAIPLTVTGSKLTLATCDSFGTKSDRFVVVASLVENHVIGS